MVSEMKRNKAKERMVVTHFAENITNYPVTISSSTFNFFNFGMDQ
jgi:hypothetical protein